MRESVIEVMPSPADKLAPRAAEDSIGLIDDLVGQLSPQQQDTLGAVALGLRTKEIAFNLPSNYST